MWILLTPLFIVLNVDLPPNYCQDSSMIINISASRS